MAEALELEAQPAEDLDRDFVQSLASGLQVIRAFDGHRQPLSVSGVAHAAGMTRAKARRLLLTLQTLGYVGGADGRFRLLPKIMDLGFAYLSTQDVWSVAEPVMRDVTDQLGESCSAGILDGVEVAVITRVPGRRMVTVTLSVGARIPAWATAMGRVLLADLPTSELEARLAGVPLRPLTRRTVHEPAALRRLIAEAGAQGYGIVDQELEDGLISVAAPVRSRRGRVVAALNLCSHVSRMDGEAMRREYLPPLQAAAEQIGRAIA